MRRAFAPVSKMEDSQRKAGPPAQGTSAGHALDQGAGVRRTRRAALPPNAGIAAVVARNTTANSRCGSRRWQIGARAGRDERRGRQE